MMYDNSSEESRGRPFICPCGKNYLSYPALFTHVKHKHNGCAPGQLIKPPNANRRGRPRKVYTDLPINLLPPLPDYKKSANHLLFSRFDLETPLSYDDQTLFGKSIDKLNYSFIPPIPSSHLLLIKNYHSMPKTPPPPSDKFEPPKDPKLTPALLDKLKAVFTPLSSGNYLNTAQLQALINSNDCYVKLKAVRRRNLRKVLGKDKLEIDLWCAVLQFLEAAEDELSKRQFKNLEVLMGLLMVYYLQILQSNEKITTQTYVIHINNFTKSLLHRACYENFYKNVFGLQKHVAVQLLGIFHQWLITQKLTEHQLKVNPLFQLEDQENEKESQENEKENQEKQLQGSENEMIEGVKYDPKQA